eukprot:TRINITY_DN24684_c0_g1_i1.p1 TRINITY_DN24684_c0_g1~~TRINITY_DN24684_c0_g1_i1.p1  ORF type:complete len:580 (+),score=91.31 TRINITY_DN24684_c0_g1_i1:26-1741(+)
METPLQRLGIRHKTMPDLTGTMDAQVTDGRRRSSLTIDVPEVDESQITGGIEVAREYLEQVRAELNLGVSSPLVQSRPKTPELQHPPIVAGLSAAPPIEDCGEVVPSVLGSAEVFQLERILAAPGGPYGYTVDQSLKIARLCASLHFFKRLQLDQIMDVVQRAEHLHVETGDVIYKEGDPLGWVFVVLNGSVAVQRCSEDTGGRNVFTSTVYDGKAFGDRWDHGGEGRPASAGRWTTAVAQEDTHLLKIDTSNYLAAMTKSAGKTDSVAVLKQLSFLKACTADELEVLGLMLEAKTVHHGEHPTTCHILCEGSCQLRTAETPSRQSLFVKDLLPGSCFGLGALLEPQGLSTYASCTSVLVESIKAQFYTLGRRSLQLLPDAVQDKILQSLEKSVRSLEDPIQDDGQQVMRRDREWRQHKNRLLSEVHRCSDRSAASAASMRSGGVLRPGSAPWRAPGEACPRLRYSCSSLQLPSKSATVDQVLGSRPSSPASPSRPSPAATPAKDLRRRSRCGSDLSNGRRLRCGSAVSAVSQAASGREEDDRPMACFRRSKSKGWVLLSRPAPLSPLSRR